jgi:hypothetical protein
VPGVSVQETIMADYFAQFSYLLDVPTIENAALVLEFYSSKSRVRSDQAPCSEGFALAIGGNWLQLTDGWLSTVLTGGQSNA